MNERSAQLPLTQRVAQLRDCLEQMAIARRELEKGALDIHTVSALRRLAGVIERLIEDAIRYG